MQIYLVRHGITEWNKEKIIQGHRDIPLAPEGKKQAQKIARFFKDKDLKKAYSSDLSRARETAQIITAPLDIEPVCCSQLREFDMGNWVGLTWDEVAEKYPHEMHGWVEDPITNGPGNGENVTQAARRFHRAFLDITNPEKNNFPILIVAHAGVIATLIAYISDNNLISWREYSPENTTVTEIQRDFDKLELKSFNRPVS